MSSQATRRSEQAGLFHFFKEMGSALVMALIAIVYVIQAFKIPTGSMENSLLVGDFLLGLKFIYGAPVLPFAHDLGITTRLPAVTQPKPGDVVIFKYPGFDKKDYIKRCVAGPGQTIEIQGSKLIINNKEVILPPKGKYIYNGQLSPDITNFKPLYIPKKGDEIDLSTAGTREFVFYRHLIKQENIRGNIKVDYQLYLDGELALNENIQYMDPFTNQIYQVPFSQLKLDSDDWTKVEEVLTIIRNSFPGRTVDVKRILSLNNERITKYKVKNDNYFMMGDNRDNSLDSRYWGFLNKNYVKAKAFILYFSLDSETPYYLLPLKIRWNRIGKLIRSWDGITVMPPAKF